MYAIRANRMNRRGTRRRFSPRTFPMMMAVVMTGSVYIRRRRTRRRRRTILNPNRTTQSLRLRITTVLTTSNATIAIPPVIMMIAQMPTCLTTAPHVPKRPALPAHALRLGHSARRARLEETAILAAELLYNGHIVATATTTQRPTANKQHQAQTEKKQRTLHNGHSLLPNKFIRQ